MEATEECFELHITQLPRALLLADFVQGRRWAGGSQTLLLQAVLMSIRIRKSQMGKVESSAFLSLALLKAESTTVF